MKPLLPAPVLFVAALIVAGGAGLPLAVPAPANGQSAQATATPIPPPTDEPAAPTAPPAPAATPAPTPKPRPRATVKAAPLPAVTPAPATPAPATEPPAAETPVPRGTPIPLPRTRRTAPTQPRRNEASGSFSNPTIPQYERESAIAKTLREPIPEIAQIEWMRGTWSCTVSSHADPHAPLKTVAQTTFVYDLTMNKRWLFGADGKGTEQHEITYDPLRKQWIFVRLGYNPSYGVATSASGWSQNAIQFVDDVEYVDGRDTHRRWTLTKRSPTHFTMSDEEQTLEGDWLLDDEYDFTKSGS